MSRRVQITAAQMCFKGSTQANTTSQGKLLTINSRLKAIVMHICGTLSEYDTRRYT